MTHDIAEAVYLSDRVVVLEKDRGALRASSKSIYRVRGCLNIAMMSDLFASAGT